MGRFLKDLRITVRTLARARGFTAASIITLGLGIALAAFGVAVVNAYLVRSLPFPAADRLYSVSYAPPGENPPPGLAELPWAKLSDVVEHPIAWDLDVFYLTGGDQTEAAPGAWVTPGFMAGLGIRVGLGRAFGAADFEPGAPQVALISDDLWRSRFGGDASVIGRRIAAYVSDRPRDPDIFTVVGVLPADFWHLNRYTQVLTPLRAQTYPYFVRLREGVPVASAEQRITALVRGSRAALPNEWRVALQPVHERHVASVKPMLLATGAAVGLVLLMACANVALLGLLRGMRRQKEIALRLALGAGRWEIARTLLLETMVIAVAAAAAGTFVAWLALRALAPTIEQQLGARVPGGPLALSIDPTVIAAIGALTIAIAVVLSLAPFVATTRHGLFTTLRQTRAASTGGPSGRRTRFALIGLEVAGSLALVVACGLMVQSVVRMLAVELGLDHRGVMTAGLAIREQSYPDAAGRVVLYDRLLATLGGAAGISSAALSSPSPLVSYNPQPVRTDADAVASMRASVRYITGGYFETLAIPIERGRPFGAGDRGASDAVAIVSASAARRLWPDASALGRRIRLVEEQLPDGDTATVVRTIVGVAADVRESPTDSALSEIYVPMLQAPGRYPAIVARTREPSAAWAVELRRMVGTVDREIAVNSPQYLDAAVDRQLSRPRFLAGLFAAFGIFASMLGVIGLYAVIAYAVKQREHEIAIRMAVGAGAGAIVNLFMREGVLLLVAGIAAGAVAAVGLGRLLESQLFGVSGTDPLTILASSIGLGLVSVAAIWWPARRATATDPMIALKGE